MKAKMKATATTGRPSKQRWTPWWRRGGVREFAWPIRIARGVPITPFAHHADLAVAPRRRCGAPITGDARRLPECCLSAWSIRRRTTTVVMVEFAAPIPAGNEALFLTIERQDGGFFDVTEVEAIVDLSTRIVYADFAYWTVLKEAGWPAAPVADDPIACLGAGWKPKRSFKGRIAGALLSTRDTGDTNHIRTVLHALPDVERGYRG
jgi:hypothetical protein